MKKLSAMTATRLRFRVSYAVPERGVFYRTYCARKADALKFAKLLDIPADITDTMAKIGAQQVWRVTEDGMARIKRRMA